MLSVPEEPYKCYQKASLSSGFPLGSAMRETQQENGGGEEYEVKDTYSLTSLLMVLAVSLTANQNFCQDSPFQMTFSLGFW